MRGRPRGAHRFAAGPAAARVLLASAALAAPLLATLSPGPVAAAAGVPAPPAASAPLASGAATAGGSWAVVAMGQLGEPLNTFWQLFFRPAGAAAWKLVTPPGVADNGGLTATVAADGTAAVGFEPSQLLRYSPLAVSIDSGGTWTPALVPTSLAAGPDALALTHASGPALALVRRGTGAVLSGTGSLLTWAPVAGSAALRDGAAPACRIEGLDAVAYSPSSSPLVGTGCGRPGRVGVFLRSASGWRLVGPSLTGPLAGTTTRVLRLQATGSTTTALVAEQGAGPDGLLGLWRSASGGWRASRPLPLAPGQRVLSTAVGPDGEQAVELSGPAGGVVVATVAGPGEAWSTLPTPPAGTVTLAAPGQGSVVAFSVHGAGLRIFTLAGPAAQWTLSQSMQVPIAYGSS